MESPWDGGTKVCSHVPGHITKMAAMPICGKNLKKSSPEPKGRWSWNLVCSIGCLSLFNDDSGLTLTCFTARSNLVPYAFVWEKGKWQEVSVDIKNLSPGGCLPLPWGYIHALNHKKCIKSDFKEIFFKLATNDRRDKMFLLTSKFRPQGVVSPCPGAIYIIKSWKNLF